MAEILSSLPNHHNDNYDYHRFGSLPMHDNPLSLKAFARKLLARRGYQNVIDLSQDLLGGINSLKPYWMRFEKIFYLLDDQQSRDLLVKLLAFRCLGYCKVKLPLNTPEYWNGIKRLEELIDGSDYIEIPFNNIKLYRMNLSSVGIPINLYFTCTGVYKMFVLQQYRYELANGAIQVEPGDIAIDAGSCWGDTALYFANKVGPQGRVYSYEFIPSALCILKRNTSLNPELKNRIELIERAAWNISDQCVTYVDHGPGSKICNDELEGATGEARTLSIDDLVRRNNLPKVDFIKMDIEGSELEALKGAVDTIKRFQPKLAISVYHNLWDYVDIPEYIDSLHIGYTFYLRHASIHSEETVLFAKTSNTR